MTLASQTRKTLEDFVSALPSEQQATVSTAFAQLLASDIAASAKNRGDTAPDFSLPGAGGKALRLNDVLKEGPVVLSFYRGSWCPFCNLELNALQQRMDDITACGARLVAVSPEQPDASLSHAETLGLRFDVLSDPGNAVAARYGLIMTVPESLRPLYREWGIDLPVANGDDSYNLPVPATYVIDRSGVIRASYVEKDYTKRMEPEDIVHALQAL